MKTIIKFKSIDKWDGAVPIACYFDERHDVYATGPIKRIKYDDKLDVVEIVDIWNTIYRKASGKKRGRPKKAQATE